MTARLGDGPSPDPLGLRVVMDTRPLEEPARGPTTAAYLAELLSAYEANPLANESFAFLVGLHRPDPTEAFAGLDVVARRRMPPSRLLRSAALTVDPFLLRGAAIGAAWWAEAGGAAGAVFHTAAGAVPIGSRLPLVVTLLDLAPWELPAVYQRSPAAAFGQRLRARILREAAAVIVGTEAIARSAHELLRIRPERLVVIPLAARSAFRPVTDPPTAGRVRRTPAARLEATGGPGDPRSDRERLGLPERYLVYPGRYDARQDLASLLGALGRLTVAGRPGVLEPGIPWPPRVLLLGATPDDRAALARASAREGVGDLLAYAPNLSLERVAALVADARAAILPAISDATGWSAIEALAAGTPVIASAVGALPGIVGGAGILVEPRDPDRLAAAIAAAWNDDGLWSRLRAEALARTGPGRRTWAEVARATRAVYTDVGTRRSPEDEATGI
ncbi:MAG: glycosyltransferase [Candidatus Limnocylindrales bacterium]